MQACQFFPVASQGTAAKESHWPGKSAKKGLIPDWSRPDVSVSNVLQNFSDLPNKSCEVQRHEVTLPHTLWAH